MASVQTTASARGRRGTAAAAFALLLASFTAVPLNQQVPRFGRSLILGKKAT
jgi:hypothetical protein